MSADPPSDPRLGQVLRGKYRLERVLGAGGMATVYIATHRNRRKFAVKVLHTELSAHAEIRARFQREGYVANTVGHPGAVAVLDDDVAEDGSAFLVMELLDGMTVDEVWEKNGQTLPVQVVLAIADQLLDVLEAAHTNGIIHRDIKPANLFLTREGVLKVLDFGIARLRDSTNVGMTQTGTTMGTPAFMSPEQARGTQTELDPQADLWSAAATLFTLLSGKLVHEGENSQMLLVNLLTQPARALLSVAPQVPHAPARVIDRALLFDKSARFPSAAVMRDALLKAELETFGAAQGSTQKTLAELLKTQPPAAQGVVESQATFASARPPLRSLRHVMIAAGALALVVVAAFVVLEHRPVAEDARPGPAAPSVVVAPSSAGVAPVPAANADDAARPDGKRAGTPRYEGINPRAAPPRHAPPPSAPASAIAPAKVCARMLERQGLGELLTPQESNFFAQHCRR